MEINELKETIEEVREHFPNTDFPDVGKEPIFIGRNKRFLDNRFAIIDQKTDQFYAFVTGDYQLVPHEIVVKKVMDAVSSLEFDPKIYINFINNGAKMQVTVGFDKLKMKVEKGDIYPTIGIRNSYDLGWRISGIIGAMRVICSNGLVIRESGTTYTQRHIMSSNIESFTEFFINGIEDVKNTLLFKELDSVTISIPVYEKLWENLPFSENEKTQIETIPETAEQFLLPEKLNQGKLTALDMFNVITQFTTHNITSDIKRAEIPSKITSIFKKVM